MTTVFLAGSALWNFSVWDDDVAKTLTAKWENAVLHYREFRYVPPTCSGKPLIL